MGANASNLIPVSSITPWGNSDSHLQAKLSKADFLAEVPQCCVGGDAEDVERFTELWGQVWPLRQKDHPATDRDLIEAGAFSYVVDAFRHKDDDWREAGIRIAYTFFYHDDIRKKLMHYDFIGSLLLMSFIDTEDDDQEGEGSSAEMKERLENQSDLQHLAVRIMCEMAKYDEFKTSLCSTATLNFLCIAMNQIPAASESVTHTFVRLSNCEEHLAALMEGAVGSILESFFKKVNFRRHKDADRTEILQWKHDSVALGYCAHTLGTLAKYNHICQVYLPKIINVFDYSIAREQQENVPMNVCLVAEMSRLLYWICRRSPDQVETLRDASRDALAGGHQERDVLETLVTMWKKSVELHGMVEDGNLSKFTVDDYDDSNPPKELDPDSYEVKCKVEFAQMSLCYLNCLLWVLLPVSNLRWRLKSASADSLKLHYAFALRQESFLQVVLGTMRHLVDMPQAHDCNDLIAFFGKQLLKYLDLAQRGKGWEHLPYTALRLLLETISVLAMQRGMQRLLADNDIWGRLNDLQRKIEAVGDMEPSVDLAMLRIFAEVAIHPRHRLSWLMERPRDGACSPRAEFTAEEGAYPPRDEFTAVLEHMIGSGSDNTQTLASLLLTNFQTGKLQKKPEKEFKMTFKLLLDWWQVNSTSRYEEAKMVVAAQQNSLALQNSLRVAGPTLLKELLQSATKRKQESRMLTSIETLPYCAPHECVLVLSFFSRLALEPKFKKLFYDVALDALLACVCAGVWAEAREAAATIANLMWCPDLNQELLVCWLKFDSASSTMVDAANVLLPIACGNPQPAEIGRGMYESTWGIEFVEGSCVALHPDGLRTYQVPSTLTSASPMDTFACAPAPYEWLDEKPDDRHFTVTCWFHWPLAKQSQAKGREHVLIQSTDRLSQIYYESYDNGEGGRWVLINEEWEKIPLKTPELNPGWHMLALVSSTRWSAVPFEGTKFYLDDIATPVLKNTWTKNDFYIVGNDMGHLGKSPFGLISDFRIYARTLAYEEIKAMARPRSGSSHPLDSHPDRIVRRLTERNAAAILALRLDVPDSAAECLRALGGLATLVSQRARIYHLCGRQLMQMLNSPLPMIRRQATRILNSLR